MLKRNKIFSIIKEYSLMTFASFCFAIALHTFILPNKLVSGGMSGFAAILELTLNFPVKYGIVLLNLPLLILSLIYLSKDFAIKTVYSTFMLSIMKSILESIDFFTFSTDKLVAVVMSGILMAISISMMYYNNSSNGGSEVITRLIIRKNPNANLASLVMIIDSSSLVVAGLFINLWVIIFSLIMNYVASIVLGMLFAGVDPALKFTVLTNKPYEIFNAISTTFKRGATVFDATDGNENELKCVSVVLQFRQQGKFKRIIKQVDSNCVAYSVLINEVMRPKFNHRYK